MHAWRRALAEELEERILYSADFAPAILAVERWDAAGAREADLLRTQVATSGIEVAVVDVSVPEADQLLADLEAQRDAGRALEIVRIEAGEDGIDRITAALEGRTDIAAVHLLSHGDDGSVRLGTAHLDTVTLLARAQQIALWGAALAPEADLLLYGCEVAATPVGQSLVQGLAALTGADVAASEDLTGFGGNWQLEYRQGSVEAALAPSAAMQHAYTGAFAAGPSSKAMAIYTQSGQPQPQVNAWDGLSFGAATASTSIGQLRNVEAADAPTRDETIVIGVDAAGAIRAERYDGGSGTWSTLALIGSTSESNRAGFAVAYEQASGDALLVWNDNTQPAGSKLNYAVWNGTTLSAPAAVGGYAGGEPQYLQIAAKPGSDEMVLVVSDASSDYYALVWSGSAWGNAVTLETTGSAEQDQTALDVAYESVSGHAMVAYGQNGDSQIYYRHWNGSAWSAETAATFPGVALADWNFIALASDPNSDRIVFGGLRQELLSYTQAFSVWSGSAWGPVSTASTLSLWDQRSVAVAFESHSGEALAAYEIGDNKVYYRTWTPAGGWSAQVTGPDLGSNSNTLALFADPDSDQIMLGALDASRDLNFIPWTGSAWGPRSELSTDTGDTTTQPFVFVFRAGAATSGASLWLSPESDASSPGWPGVNAVAKSEVVALSHPNLAFAPSTTGGTFSHVFDIDDFAADGNAQLAGLHYVARPVALPGFTLQAGDVLLSLDSNETLVGDNTLAVLDDEVVVFRPNAPGDYRSGRFIQLLDDFGTLHGGGKTKDFALVEQDTGFGEIILGAGTFVFTRDGGAESKNVYQFVPTAVGAGSTAGTVSVLLNGSHTGIDQGIAGVHLASTATPIGNAILAAGTLLLTLDGDDAAVGANALATRKEDVFRLSIVQTSLSGIAQVTASTFFNGADIGIGGERFDAIALYTANSAPVLDTSGAPALLSVIEDDAAPAGTSVAALLASGASGDPISDADTLDPEGIAVVGLDAANGTWQFSTDAGASWMTFGALSSTGATLLDTASLLRFIPNPNYSGVAALQFRAWDHYTGSNGQTGVNTTLAGGSSAFSSAIETATIAVVAVNDDPVLTLNAGLTVTQGATVVIGPARLSTADIDHATAQIVYTLAALPTHGTLKLNGIDLTLVGNTFTQADIHAGLLQYANDGTPNPADSFRFDVTDAAGGSAGATATFNISVTTTNAAPSITANWLNISEGTSAAPTLAATDLDNTPDQLVYTVNAVSGGHFELTTNPGAAVVNFTQAQIDGAFVRFIHDGGEAPPSYTVLLSDGDASDGPSAGTIVFTNVNDAPVMTNAALTIVEGGSAQPVLAATDADDAAATLVYTVSSVVHGHFERVSAPGVAVTSFSQADVDAAEVIFVHDGGEDAPSFQVSVSDGAASVGPQQATISFTSANDAPVIAAASLSLSEGQSVVLTGADIGASDPDAAAGDLVWTVSGLSGGRFEYAAAAGVAIITFTQDEIDAGAVRFVHDGTEAAPAFSLALDDGAASAGPQAAAIAYAAVDDAPVLTVNTGASLVHGDSIVITAGMLSGSDVDSAQSMLHATLTAVPLHGTLSLNGIMLGVGDAFSQADVDAGLLSYQHDASATTSDGFSFQLADATNTLPVASFALSVTATQVVPSVAVAQPPVSPTPSPAAASPSGPVVTTSRMQDEVPASVPFASQSEEPRDSVQTPQRSNPSLAAAGDARVQPLPGTASDRFADTDAARVRWLASFAEAGSATSADNAFATVVGMLGRAASAGVQGWALPGPAAQAQAHEALTVRELDTLRNFVLPPAALLELEQVREQLETQVAHMRTVVASTIAISTGLSVGYVLWLVRGGLLLTSVLSTLPAWQVIDPLPVLGSFRRSDEDEEASSPDSVEDLFRRVRPPPEPTLASASARTDEQAAVAST